MNSLYTKGPSNVPEGITKPNKSFKKHVWLSVIGLLLFISLYFLLTIWFAKLSYNLFLGNGGFWNMLLAVGFAFLSIFMVKSLFFVTKRQKDLLRKYLNQKDEPVLFDYLYKLADEAGAPRPHKVFLTNRVNASVSYDLSIFNLIFPSKKNLEIGLGLLNVLSLGEFKAVLAHEYGHFAQRSMLLGRYVYIAQQIAARIVTKRDFLDDILSGISRFDLRLAWIGWILSILVWAIRSLIESCFSVVAIAERALSREMEFQADLVAVSLTGSDALIHALYKLQVADEAYSNALEVTNNELANKNAVSNLYVLQSNFIDKMSWVLNDSSYGKSPRIKENKPESNRIFSSRTYNPPQMWSTHPADKDREENAKRNYIGADIDERPAKLLLSNSKDFEINMTSTLVSTAKVETKLISDAECIATQNRQFFDWTFLDPKYNSCYFGRFSFVNFEKADDIFDEATHVNLSKEEFGKLYPKELNLKTNQLKEVKEEIAALIISQNEVITAEKRIITHRGEQIKRDNIPEILSALKVEEEALRNEISTHDRLSRLLHYKAAKSFGKDWSTYLKKLSGLVHYSEHAIANLNDSSNKFHNVLNMALADGRVSTSELSDILSASDDYFFAVKKIFSQSKTIKLDEQLLTKLKTSSYEESYEKFTLTEPEKDNINDWVNVIDGWSGSALLVLDKLRNVTLEHLLDTEEIIKEHFLNGSEPLKNAPKGIVLVDRYDVLLPGRERKIQRKLNFWNRFFIGDGLVPSVAKFGVSAAMVFGALFFGNYSQKSTLYVYNGLNIPIDVQIDGETLYLEPNSHQDFPINYDRSYNIVSKTIEGDLIEQLRTDFNNPSEKYIYNIANSGVFIEYPIFYGYDDVGIDTYLGSKRWLSSSADYVLSEPPSSISMSSGSKGERRDGVNAFSYMDPYDLISVVEDKDQVEKTIRSHARWDNDKSKYLIQWMNLLDNVKDYELILAERLNKDPKDIYSHRALLDHADSIQRIQLCNDYNKKAQAQPDDSELYYLSCRCIDSESKKNDAFIDGYKKWGTNSWLAFASAYVYVEREEWKKAFYAFGKAAKNNPSLGERIAIDAERVRRVLASKFNPKVFSNSIIESENIDFYNALENGELENPEQNPNNGYYLMSKGEIHKSYSFIKNHEDFKPYLLRFLAASKHTNDDIIKDALALTSDKGINYNTVWPALGLAVNHKMDTSTYLNSIDDMGIDSTVVNAFLVHLKNSEYRNAENTIASLDFVLKAHYYVLGHTILGNKTPAAWKDYINLVLFANERPFI